MKLQYGKNLDAGTSLKCWIPFYNIIVADIGYYGKLFLASYGMFALLVVPLRFACWYYAYDNSVISATSQVLFWVGLIFWYFANVANSIIIMKDSGVISIGKAIVFSIIYPFGYMYIGNILVAEMNRQANKLSTSGGGRL
jgi:hypothetical protein